MSEEFQEQFTKQLLSFGNYPFYSDENVKLGGVIKTTADDFVVEELPLYEPCGEGDHRYVLIEKRNISTNGAIARIAEVLGIHPRSIGVAGQKDARAVSRQTLSFEHVSENALEGLSIPGIQILAVDRHKNKLKMGHLAGNRFSIKVRQANPIPLDIVRQLMAWLVQNGVPNFFGVQRFGSRGDNWLIGKSLLRGEYKEALQVAVGRPTPDLEGDAITVARRLFDEEAWLAAADAWPRGYGNNAKLCRTFDQTNKNYKRTMLSVGKKALNFYVSAYQSYLFNQLLAARVESGHLQQMFEGDIAWKHDKGVCFVVENAQEETRRAQAGEISPSGPLYGKKMKRPVGSIGELEAEILQNEGMLLEQFSQSGPFSAPGGRRPFRIFPQNAQVTTGQDSQGDYYKFDFDLPAGAYATVVLREICKLNNLEE